MASDEARAFIAANHRAVLATNRSNGMAQLSPVTAGVDAQGRAVISTRETAFKTRNLRRDPRCTLLVFTDQFFGPWVTINGEAEIVSLPEALPLLEDYYRSVQGEHPDWEEYRHAMRSEGRVLLRLQIENVGPRQQA